MKTRLLIIIIFALISFVFPNVDASCDPYDYECGVADPSFVNQYGVELGYALVIVPPSILGILLVFIIVRNRK